MTASTTLIDQLASLGVYLPAWPNEPEPNEATDDLIDRGKSYAETVRLWRAQLRNAPESTKGVVDQLFRHLQVNNNLGVWDQIVYADIKPEVQGSPEYERWQVCTKLIRSSALTPAQLLGITLLLANEERLAAAIYGMKRLLKEQSGIDLFQRQQLLVELVASANTNKFITYAKSNLVNWNRAVELHSHFTRLLKASFVKGIISNHSQVAEPVDQMEIFAELDALNDCIGRRGVHGHADFIAVCYERLPQLLEGWTGERPCIVEVGCSREIIEGQNSTVQLLKLAKELNIPFIGIDLDQENIHALKRDYSDYNATWIVGKGEKVLQGLNKSIAAIYLDAYDFWHTSHSDFRQKSYLEFYGSQINDTECYAMHLEATHNSSKHIPPGGLIGLDDTWLEDDQWVGKGALALPWLVEQGWELLSSANRGTVLLNTGSNQ